MSAIQFTIGEYKKSQKSFKKIRKKKLMRMYRLGREE
jgi:hypothetical protein